MLYRMLQVGCFAVVVSMGSMTTKSAQAQSPFGSSCSNGNGFNNQSFYGQPNYGQQAFGQHGYVQPRYQQYGYGQPVGNYVSNYYGAQPGFAPQPPMGYGGGYSSPAFNLNQSFYPGSSGHYSAPQHQPHHSHHSWHLGHYLLGHH